MENSALQNEAPTRQVGLIDLFAMIAVFMPVVATIARVKREDGCWLQYFIALPLGIALGPLIVSAGWKLGKAIWIRFENASESVKNAVGIGLFVFQLFWIFVGLVAGDKLGAFVVSHFPR